MLFTRSTDESFVQTILKTYQNFILALGTLNLPVPRQAFLTSLEK